MNPRNATSYGPTGNVGRRTRPYACFGWKADVLNERTGKVTFGLRLRHLAAAGSLEKLSP